MTDRQLEERLRAWYTAEIGESETAPAELRASVSAIPATTPAPLRPLSGGRRVGLLAVAAVLLVGGALAAGSGLLRLTSVVPPAPAPTLPVAVATAAPSTSVTPMPSATPQPIEILRPGSLVAFIRGDSQIWVYDEDSRGARMLAEGVGDHESRLAWSPDGSQLLHSDGGKLFLIDVEGGDSQLLDTGCVAGCLADAEPAFSRDATKIVFVRRFPDSDPGQSFGTIATMDLASGRVELLDSTAPESWAPAWSPDGQQIVYSSFGDDDVNALFVVDESGSNARQITPPRLSARSADWSPDGSRIVFTSSGVGPKWAYSGAMDIYTIRPDGSDVRRLTTDGVSSSASWSADGRILFAKDVVGGGGVSLWTMDADGANATMLVPADAVGVGYDEFPPVRVARQPLGGPPVGAVTRPSAPATTVGPPAPTPTPPDLAPGFSWTGRSTFKKPGETATLLTDGRVLLTAECDTAAELYDPARRWTCPVRGRERLRPERRRRDVGIRRAVRPDDRHVQPDRFDDSTALAAHGHAPRRRSRAHRRGDVRGGAAVGRRDHPRRVSDGRGRLLPRHRRDLRPEDGDVQQDGFDEHSPSRAHGDPAPGRPGPRRRQRWREQPCREGR